MNVGDVRSKEHMGIVTSDTSTGKLSFFVTPLKNKAGIVEGDFVVVDHPAFGELCPLLAVVKEINNYEEVVGTTLVEKSVQTVAVAEILGFVDLRDESWRLSRLIVPPSPGSKVFMPCFEFLENVFLRDMDGMRFEHALHLGSLATNAVSRNGQCKPLDFYLDARDFRRQHFLIAGMTGTGKTHTATIVVEELANKANLPVVVLDGFSEYTSVCFGSKHFEELTRTGTVPAKDYPFKFGVSVLAFDPGAVKRRLEKQGISVKKDDRLSIRQLSGKWREFPDEKALRAVREELSDAVKPGQVLVLDGNGMGLEERRKLFSCCVSALWSCRVDESVEPFVLVIDNAEAVERELLERVASEGRKFGVSMCLATQHLSGISGKVLSQIGSFIMGRMTDNEDLDRLKTAAREKSALLPNLRTGEWIVNWVAVGRPVKVSVRDRYSLST